MSIEALLQAHIDALKENTAAVLMLETSLVGRASGKPKAELAKEEKLKTETKVEVKEEKKDPVEAADSNNENNAKAAEDLETKSATSYGTLRELVLKLAKGDKRPGIQAVLKKHGLGNAKDLLSDAEDFSSVKDQDKLETVYADLLALEA